MELEIFDGIKKFIGDDSHHIIKIDTTATLGYHILLVVSSESSATSIDKISSKYIFTLKKMMYPLTYTPEYVKSSQCQ